jgi:hypothetical protein
MERASVKGAQARGLLDKIADKARIPPGGQPARHRRTRHQGADWPDSFVAERLPGVAESFAGRDDAAGRRSMSSWRC